MEHCYRRRGSAQGIYGIELSGCSEWRIRLWEGPDGALVGWAWLHLPDEAELHVLPEHRRVLIPEILAWLTALAGADPLVVSALDRDELTTQALLASGFLPNEHGAFNAMVLPLDRALPEPALPAGFRLRHVQGHDDLPRRVAVHRAAWSVFGPSRVTEESYGNVMAAWPYRQELDWVVEAPDGSFVSSCLIWFDEDNGVGELEPVGTDPAFLRRGFASAVCTAALRTMRDLGADTAIVYSTEVEGKPSAPSLYRALGFETRGRHLTFTRTLR